MTRISARGFSFQLTSRSATILAGRGAKLCWVGDHHPHAHDLSCTAFRVL